MKPTLYIAALIIFIQTGLQAQTFESIRFQVGKEHMNNFNKFHWWNSAAATDITAGLRLNKFVTVQTGIGVLIYNKTTDNTIDTTYINIGSQTVQQVYNCDRFYQHIKFIKIRVPVIFQFQILHQNKITIYIEPGIEFSGYLTQSEERKYYYRDSSNQIVIALDYKKSDTNPLHQKIPVMMAAGFGVDFNYSINNRLSINANTNFFQEAEFAAVLSEFGIEYKFNSTKSDKKK